MLHFEDLIQNGVEGMTSLNGVFRSRLSISDAFKLIWQWQGHGLNVHIVFFLVD